MADILNFVEEKEKRLQEHLAGKCVSKKEIEDETEQRKKENLRKQLRDRAISNARIVAELTRNRKGGPNGPQGA